MKIAFLLSAYNPCQEHRLVAPARAFESPKHIAKLVFAGSGFTPAVLAEAARADVVQMSYCCRREEVEAIWALRRRGAMVAVDYDDNLLQHEDPAVRRGVVSACALANLLTVSTGELRRVFGGVCRTPIAVLSNRVDTRAWRPRPPGPRPAPYVIGYAGSRTHTRDLEQVAEALWAVLRTRQDALLRVLGCQPLPVPADIQKRVSWRPWTPLSGIQEAFQALDPDVAIAPLVDTPFNRGRSALKWMQFGALGVPMVAQRLEPYSTVILDGYDGYLAGDLAEWETRLLALARYPRIRARMGQAARERVERDFDLKFDRRARIAAYRQVLPHYAAANPQKGDRGDSPEPGAAGPNRPLHTVCGRG